MPTVYLGLGSNLGNRKKNIEDAISALKENNIIIEKVSGILETDPVGGPVQNKFLNAVLKSHTNLSPAQLLTTITEIEKKLGRKRTVLNGPRTIDIDILLYDKINLQTPELVIPHPRMKTRNFVMNPLKEIDPTLAEEILQ